MDNVQDAETAAIKVAAATAIGRLEAMRERNLDEVGRASSWLRASLLAINGGGAIATMNVADRLSSPGCVGALFIGGIFAAMLNAYLIQTYGAKTQPHLEEWWGYWRAVEQFGVRDEEKEKAVQAKLTAQEWWGRVAPWPGWLSAPFFLAATVALGLSLREPSKPAPSRCATLERSMLAKAPEITNAAAAYEALGCGKL